LINEKSIISKWCADIYDQNVTETDDVDFLLSVIGQQPKKILEVCCGSGRILVPLAKAGHTVSGFDADQFMLDKIPAKAEGRDNIEWHNANAVYSDWGSGFDVVVLAGNILYNIVSDMDYKKSQELFIQKAASALVPGGYIYISYGPGGHKLIQTPESFDNGDNIIWQWEGTDNDGNVGKEWVTAGSYNAETGMSKFKRGFEVTLTSGEKILREVIDGKHFAPLELIRKWLSDAGFIVELECEDFEKNPVNDDSCEVKIYARKAEDNITKLIKQDLQSVSSKPIQEFRLINAKSGVYVYRCMYDGISAVVKYFENEDDRREILNYRILAQHNIPTIKTLALGTAALVMEDISVSEQWRLGVPEDFQDTGVTKALAQWYFTFHENGSAVSELDTLYFEYDSITKENLKTLIEKFPEAKELFEFLLAHYEKLRELLFKPSFTLTYNDFHWSNFVVRKDKQAAMMFDYNLLGKGYRSSDFRNVCWDLSEEAKAAFVDEYGRLYFEKHGQTRTEAEEIERSIDDVMGSLFSLLFAFNRKGSVPDWAKKPDGEYLDGSLLAKAKLLLL
jgi:SAM-dependent methyltransferase